VQRAAARRAHQNATVTIAEHAVVLFVSHTLYWYVALPLRLRLSRYVPLFVVVLFGAAAMTAPFLYTSTVDVDAPAQLRSTCWTPFTFEPFAVSVIGTGGGGEDATVTLFVVEPGAPLSSVTVRETEYVPAPA